MYPAGKDLPEFPKPGRVGKKAGRAVQVVMKGAVILKKSTVSSKIAKRKIPLLASATGLPECLWSGGLAVRYYI